MADVRSIPSTNALTAPKRISILGATGSIGTSTLDIIREHRDRYDIGALTAQRNADALIALAREFSPAIVVIGDEAHYSTVKDALADTATHVLAGEEGLLQAASLPADISVAAIVGAAGLAPTLAAIEQGNTIAFANKECLVCAGDLMMQACCTHQATLLPVDSEHNAIFQALADANLDEVEKLTLTASGGPFRTRNADSMHNITPAEAVNHPNWDMGAKISIDSATMMNKGLELIEAHHLFATPEDEIDVVVHPESIIHSLVHYKDGSVLAQLGMPDMRIPLAYTLAWPERIAVDTPRLSLTDIATLHFEAPDNAKFPALQLARQSLKDGQAATIILNAANEVAVEAFLQERISFPAIAGTVEDCLGKTEHIDITDISHVLEQDTLARRMANELIG